MADFADADGCALLLLNEKEKSLAHFVMLYYGKKIMGMANVQKLIREYVQENFGVVLE
jgi:hypothetical protein